MKKYALLKKRGDTAFQVDKVAIEDGLNWFARMNMLSSVFGLSPVQAKEITVNSDYGVSLDEHQKSLEPALEEVLAEVEGEA